MDPWHPILSIVCFLAAYGWAQDHHLDHKVTRLLAGKVPHHGKAVYSIVKTYEPRTLLPAELVYANMRKKRRAKRNAEEGAIGDAETFLKLLELAKAVSGANPAGKSKFRSLPSDSSEYTPNPASSSRRSSSPRKGLNYRHQAEEDYAEDGKAEYRPSGRESPYRHPGTRGRAKLPR